MKKHEFLVKHRERLVGDYGATNQEGEEIKIEPDEIEKEARINYKFKGETKNKSLRCEHYDVKCTKSNSWKDMLQMHIERRTSAQVVTLNVYNEDVSKSWCKKSGM